MKKLLLQKFQMILTKFYEIILWKNFKIFFKEKNFFIKFNKKFKKNIYKNLKNFLS
jgi:hypothetical protein